MELTMEEFMSLQKDILDKASEKHKLSIERDEARKRCEEWEAKYSADVNYWKKRALTAESKNDAANYELLYIKTYIVLSMEKVKAFFDALKDIHSHSLIYTFLLNTLPEKAYQQMVKKVNEVVGLPHAAPTTAITAENVDLRGCNVDQIGFNGPITNNEGTITGDILNKE